jgi:hypothetical protein
MERKNKKKGKPDNPYNPVFIFTKYCCNFTCIFLLNVDEDHEI